MLINSRTTCRAPNVSAVSRRTPAHDAQRAPSSAVRSTARSRSALSEDTFREACITNAVE
jgi:hypothetical protein